MPHNGAPALSYAYSYTAPVNTGVPSGFDLNNDSNTPTSPGAVQASVQQGGANDSHLSPARFDTADFSDTEPGNLRADYLLPSNRVRIVNSAVFWPVVRSPLYRLVYDPAFPFAVASSDLRLVWADLRIF